MRYALCLLAALWVAGSGRPAHAIGPLRETGLLGAGRSQYFRMRPEIVDLLRSPASVSPEDTCRAVIILVDFADKSADRLTHPPGYFDEMLFGEARSTLRGYFAENSYGRFVLVGDTYGWLRSACRHDRYVNRDGVAGTKDDHGLDISSDALAPAICDYPLNVWGLVKEAVIEAADQVDFAAYDNDGPDGIPHSNDDDGLVDALFVVHSGIGAELIGEGAGSENYIWSLFSSLEYYAPTRGTVVDGVGVGPFVIVPELGAIGVHAHEFCHLMGLPDLYNSETSQPVVGKLCLMDEGAWGGPDQAPGSVPTHLSAPMKYVLGWIDPVRVCMGCGGEDSLVGARFDPVGLAPYACEVLDNPGGMDWTPEGTGRGEYFLVENRSRGWGYFESYLSGSGLIIWKVDESRGDNNSAALRLATVIQADGEVWDPDEYDLNVPGEPEDFWPGQLGKREFTPYTSPSSDLNGGRFSGVAIRNIHEEFFGSVAADIRVGLARKGASYAYPNPYRPGEGSPMRIVYLPDPGPDTPITFRVIIFDLEGNPVRRLDEPSEILGEGTAIWDGRDDGGRPVRAGLYMYSVQSSGDEATGLIGVQQ